MAPSLARSRLDPHRVAPQAISDTKQTASMDIGLLVYLTLWYLGNYYYNSASSLPAD